MMRDVIAILSVMSVGFQVLVSITEFHWNKFNTLSSYKRIVKIG